MALKLISDIGDNKYNSPVVDYLLLVIQINKKKDPHILIKCNCRFTFTSLLLVINLHINFLL